MSDIQTVYNQLPSHGWLSLGEATLLYTTAEQTEGPILEVGAYYGRSTVLLAALKRATYVVDPFGDFAKHDLSGDEIEQQFRINTAAYKNVTLFRQRIEDWQPRPCGFAYLDGKHTYEGTLAQIKAALACGIHSIAAHDVNDKGDGLNVKRACLELLGPWIQRTERLAVWQIK